MSQSAEFPDRFRVLSSLGKGGMGDVYLAEDRELGRQVAIKRLSRTVSDDPDAQLRFQREARSASRLDHPNICRFHDVVEAGGTTFLVMEPLAGETLDERLKRGPLPLDEALRWARQVAEALCHAHAKRIVHRDLKPANLMISGDTIKVMDFGLAKELPEPSDVGSEEETQAHDMAHLIRLTQAGTRVGTLAYMSPEQWLGAPVDERSDVFSFGILFFEMLTATHPFQRSDVLGTLGAILKDPHPPLASFLSGPTEDLDAIFDRLLAKEAKDRYPSFEEVRSDLARVEQGERVAAPGVRDAAAREPAPGRHASFVGRERELKAADALLEELFAGKSGAVLFIGGEAGVGKTRLAEEVLARARKRGFLAVRGRCYESEGMPPFVPFVEALQQLSRNFRPERLRELLADGAPEIARILPELRATFADIPRPMELAPEQRRHFLFNNVAAFLERVGAERRLVVLVDDLQWADDATLLLLEHIARNCASVLLVGTYRDDQLHENLRLRDVLEALGRERLARRLLLGALSEDDVHRFVEALSGRPAPSSLARRIFELTEGNPFFAEEVFRHLREEGRLFDADGAWLSGFSSAQLDVPEGVRLVVERRLDRLSGSTLRLACAAAVIGRDFGLKLLSEVTKLDDDDLFDAIEEAEHERIVTGSEVKRAIRYRFQHELIRQTLLSRLSAPRQARLHLRIARAMEELYGSDPGPFAADLARHWYLAGESRETEKTVRFLGLAIDRSLEALAFEEALGYIDMVLSILPPDADAAVRARLHDRRGLALRGLGSWEDAIAESRHAIAAYESLGDGEAVARVATGLWSMLSWRGRWHECVELTSRALDAAGGGPSPERCQLLALHGVSVGATGSFSEGRMLLDEAEELARKNGNGALLGTVLLHKAIHRFFYMRAPEQAEAALAASELLEPTEKRWEYVPALALAQNAHLSLGRLDNADEIGRDVSSVATSIGHFGALLDAGRNRGLTDLMRTGDLDRFEDFARSDLELCRKADFPWSYDSHTYLGLVRLWRGDWEGAVDEFRSAEELEAPGANAGSGRAIHFLGRAYLGEGSAVDWVERNESYFPRAGSENTFGAWRMLLRVVEGLAMREETERAAELYPLMAQALETGVIVLFWREALLEKVAGIAAASARRWDAAERHFETALQQAADIPHRIEEPEVQRWHAWMLRARGHRGDEERAAELLEQAAEAYELIGMPRHVRIVERLLRGP